jgi:peptide/nickel transport system substrate-binding protein
MGIKSPAADQMIAALINANSRNEFVSVVRALDRILLSGHYTIPLFHLRDQWVARWKRIERPTTTSRSGYLPETWWHAATPKN